MRKMFVILAAVGLFSVPGLSLGASVTMYVDTAPNVFSDPAGYNAWRAAAFPQVAAGTFQNMASGQYPNSLNFIADEAIVYSGGDGGQRLTAFYFVPNETVASLQGRFKVGTAVDWDGIEYDYGLNQPSSWVNYDANGDMVVDGVIGAFGNAFEAFNNYAPPNTGPVDLADRAALRDDMNAHQTYWKFNVQLDGVTTSLTAHLVDPTAAPVPTPAAACAGFGLLGLLAFKRRRQDAFAA